MIINVLMILAFAIGAETVQSIEPSSATVEGDHIPTIECYRNGIWYNPCPPDPESPPPPSDPRDPPEVLIPQ